MTDPAVLKAQLPRTWPVFFAHHGSFTVTQQQVIPRVLAGHNTLVVAATAAGKTEAAIAPLLERHVLSADARHAAPALRILYVCPTRALVRDLYERLALPFQNLGVSLIMKSGDTGPVSILQPPTVLITTPESTDSLLTRGPRLLATLAAVVLDEIHLFDHSVRGDHLRCLLHRIEHIRRYHMTEQGGQYAPLQRVALSATVPDAAGVASRYLDGGDNQAWAIVQIPGSRRLHAHVQPMSGLGDLTATLALHMAGRNALRKALVFCNTRNEVEQVAAFLRSHLSADAAVFVHYSNLDSVLRREVEAGFAAAPVALCVCTSTLELGIDIGSIDHVVQIGPPPS
jgi:ATP-dependent Lhr-like helicase